MKKFGSQPLLATLGSLAMAMTACRQADDAAPGSNTNYPSTNSPASAHGGGSGYLISRGYRPVPGSDNSYVAPEGDTVTEEEALARAGGATSRGGFGESAGGGEGGGHGGGGE